MLPGFQPLKALLKTGLKVRNTGKVAHTYMHENAQENYQWKRNANGKHEKKRKKLDQFPSSLMNSCITIANIQESLNVKTFHFFAFDL